MREVFLYAIWIGMGGLTARFVVKFFHPWLSELVLTVVERFPLGDRAVVTVGVVMVVAVEIPALVGLALVLESFLSPILGG